MPRAKHTTAWCRHSRFVFAISFCVFLLYIAVDGLALALVSGRGLLLIFLRHAGHGMQREQAAKRGRVGVGGSGRCVFLA